MNIENIHNKAIQYCKSYSMDSYNNKMKGHVMWGELYQKLGVIISKIAAEFLGKEIGERIDSVSEYEEKYQVSRGTIQNAFTYLKEHNAIQLNHRGHMGTFIVALDYPKLQSLCKFKSLQGIMPLPYSKGYQGIATAVYEALSDFDISLVYSRGATNRIRRVSEGIYQFAICSKHAAEKAMEDGENIKVIFDFGPKSYLTKHVVIFRDSKCNQIQEGMRVAYDRNSLDQCEITTILTKNIKGIKYIDMRADQTIAAILSGSIDAGVWNYDDILEKGYSNLHMKPIPKEIDISKLSTAVMIIEKDNDALEAMLRKNIDPKRIKKIQAEVKSGKRVPNY